jgi:hypothetical protein
VTKRRKMIAMKMKTNKQQLVMLINNKKLANGVNDNEQSKKVSWWINELDSLGIEKSSSSNNNNKSESKDSQKLEDLTDDIKQAFIHDYKTCYSDNIQR